MSEEQKISVFQGLSTEAYQGHGEETPGNNGFR
jgi:hypothetical protein